MEKTERPAALTSEQARAGTVQIRMFSILTFILVFVPRCLINRPSATGLISRGREKEPTVTSVTDNQELCTVHMYKDNERVRAESEAVQRADQLVSTLHAGVDTGAC